MSIKAAQDEERNNDTKPPRQGKRDGSNRSEQNVTRDHRNKRSDLACLRSVLNNDDGFSYYGIFVLLLLASVVSLFTEVLISSVFEINTSFL